MGCYDSTCAVTNIGIGNQEDVIMFECKSGRLYDLLGYAHRFDSDYEIRRDMDQAFADKMAKQYGREKIDASEFTTNAQDFAYKVHGIRVVRGLYSHYGWINGLESPEDLPPRFFVKASVANKIADLSDLWNAGQLIVSFMDTCRLPGFSDGPIGSQHVDEYELLAHLKRIEYIQAEIEEVRELWASE